MRNHRSADPATLFDAACAGDRAALARLLSFVERGGEQSRNVARLVYRTPGQAYTVGMTGAPGSGKSTLTDRLVAAARQDGLRGSSLQPAGPDQVAVLAIDPSSPFTGGAILGDRVRMQGHALDDGVYIRSMATRGHLGGLALAVPDAVRVLSAVGLPLVLVETVGVGQVEVEVASATDTTVVVVNPGWGDTIQANKAGLLEIADLFVINKADRPGAKETRHDLEGMLDLTELGEWRPPIVDTVASTGDGIEELWSAIADHRTYLVDNDLLDTLRRERLERELHQVLVARVAEQVEALREASGYSAVIEALAAGELDPYEASDRLLTGSGLPVLNEELSRGQDPS